MAPSEIIMDNLSTMDKGAAHNVFVIHCNDMNCLMSYRCYFCQSACHKMFSYIYTQIKSYHIIIMNVAIYCLLHITISYSNIII